MKNKYLLDTNVFVWLEMICLPPESKVKINLSETSQVYLERLISDENAEIFTSVITIVEIYSFVYMQRPKKDNGGFIYDRVRRERMLKLFEVYLPFDFNEAVLSQYVNIDLFTAGVAIDQEGEPFAIDVPKKNYRLAKNDLWIASFASANDATLVTADNDFKILSDYNEIKIIFLS